MVNFVRKSFIWVLLPFGIIALIIFFGFQWLQSGNRQAEGTKNTKPATEEAETVIITPEFINLQPTVDQWLTNYQHGKVAIMVYDFDHEQVAASYNIDAQMLPASVYKLFYTYDAYQQIDAGNDDPDEAYWGEYTLGECLDLMIRESHNPCAETMLDDPPRAQRVAKLIKDQGMTHTIPTALYTSASDVMKLLQMYYTHEGWSNESWEKFRDSALNQPPTAAGDFRQGLPSGFTTADVYNKVGWSATGNGWDIYNDVALVEFPKSININGDAVDTRHYGVVVLTNSTSNFAIADLGEMLEQAILESQEEPSSTEEPKGK